MSPQNVQAGAPNQQTGLAAAEVHQREGHQAGAGGRVELGRHRAGLDGAGGARVRARRQVLVAVQDVRLVGQAKGGFAGAPGGINDNGVKAGGHVEAVSECIFDAAVRLNGREGSGAMLQAPPIPIDRGALLNVEIAELYPVI